MGLFDRVVRLFSGGEKRTTAPFIDPNTIFRNATAGTLVNKKTAMGFTPIYCAVRLLSESISQIPVELQERLPDGDIIDRRDHKLWRMLHTAPNPEQTKQSFISKVLVDLCLEGNSYAYIDRGGGSVPQALYCLTADNIEIKFKDNEIYYNDKKSGKTYSSFEILHFKTMSQDGYVGISPLKQCKNAIGWGIAVETFGNTFFRNGAKLSGILATDRQMSTVAIDRLKKSFQEQYAGINESNKTLILEEGLKFSPVSISNEQAQFLASRDLAVQEIARIYNIPPHMLKDLSKSSFNNIEQQSTEFVRYSVMPYITNLESEMNLKLFSQSEQGKLFVNFNANSLLRGAANDRADFYEKMVKIGAMTINEVRERENMNKADTGDDLYMPMNMTPVAESENLE